MTFSGVEFEGTFEAVKVKDFGVGVFEAWVKACSKSGRKVGGFGDGWVKVVDVLLEMLLSMRVDKEGSSKSIS